jgi:hypothetical protein
MSVPHCSVTERGNCESSWVLNPKSVILRFERSSGCVTSMFSNVSDKKTCKALNPYG